MPPLLNIPERTRDLEVAQRGVELVASWTAPARTTEDMPLKDLGRMVLVEAESEEALETGRERLVVEGVEAGARVERKVKVQAEPGRRIVVAVKNYSRRGRSEGYSNVVAVEIARAPAAPGNLAATARDEGVELTWDAVEGASGYQVHRDGVMIAEVASNQHTDREVQWAKPYRYFVRPVTKVSTGVAEGSDSQVVEITPQDTFPPAAPGGLQAAVTESAVDLNWSLSPEKDTAGYHVYREGKRLTQEALGTPAFTDRAVERGAQYSYEITAVDRQGNESPRSPAARVTIP
jgi:fibronectin type 3 domain-containing protein